MSEGQDGESWAMLADYRDVLQMCIDEELPFANRARRLLERLDEYER